MYDNMNSTNITALRADTIRQFKGDREEMYRLLNERAGVTFVCDWVVVTSGDLAIKYDVSVGGAYVNPRVTSIANATRLTETTANSLAFTTKSGAGTKVEAVTVNDAYRRRIDGLNRIIDQLEALPEPK